MFPFPREAGARGQVENAAVVGRLNVLSVYLSNKRENCLDSNVLIPSSVSCATKAAS